MRYPSLLAMLFSMLAAAPLSASADTFTSTGTSTSTWTGADIHNPDHTSGEIKYFDWQTAWGSIHINSQADGLADPGTPVSSNGQVPCASGGICGAVGNPKGGNRQISNGIKYDIKNSLLNCMSKPMPNWANQHGSPPVAISYETPVCTALGSSVGISDMKPWFGTSNPPANGGLLYMPIYDSRSNDLQTIDSGNSPGCLQQITNTCGSSSTHKTVRDIHGCFNTDPSYYPATCAPGTQCDTPAYLHPVTHVFSPEEVKQLGVSQLPSVYYSYTKATSTVTNVSTSTDTSTTEEGRTVLSATDPTNSPDRVPGTPVKTIAFGSDPNLARLRSFSLADNEGDDVKSFIVMDPSDFFDLRLYIKGGKYDAGYTNVDANGNPLTFDSCPVLGLANGYGGICDPTGNAGCNLPIYGVGASTTLTDASGNSYTYNNYPVKWSGYVRSWAVISLAHYMQNIGNYQDNYLTGEDLNSNPILMIERSPDYCDATEIQAGNGKCLQYLQYQQLENNTYAFADLYYPTDMVLETWSPQYSDLVTYNLDANGNPIPNSPVKGSGTDIYTGGKGSGNKYASFLDTQNLAGHVVATYTTGGSDPQPAITTYPATKDALGNPTVGVSMTNSQGQPVKGTGVQLAAGHAASIRAPSSTMGFGGTDNCYIATWVPTTAAAASTGTQQKLFIPTYTPGELQQFIGAMNGAVPAANAPQISVRPCNAGFLSNQDSLAKEYGSSNQAPNESASTIGSTFMGAMSCAALTQKPACNQVRRISAQRFCQLESGALAGDCGPCDNLATSADPDYQTEQSTINSLQSAGGVAILSNPMVKGSRCNFTAACMDVSSAGCPAENSSGGHVFCLSPDTKITMADGTLKPIKKIKAGEQVAAFDGKFTRNSVMGKAKVKATAVTKNQQIIQINSLKITPQHKIVLANGRTVPAAEIKVGDKIMKSNGMVEIVKTIKTDLAPITVYNLVLDDGSDGYIAGGLRVMSYPAMKEMDQKEMVGAASSDKR